jgi:hypothetical protein
VAEQNGTSFDELVADNDRIQAALLRAARDAALTHARLGRTLPDWKDGQVVWLTPAEVFARYGLDENGREPASAPRPSA